MNLSFWSPGRVARAQQLIKDGLSASQVAFDLGCSRNAVIGKLHRSHVSWTPLPRPAHHNKRRSRPRPFMACTQTVNTIIPEWQPEPSRETWVRFADLEPRHCRFPVEGAPGPEMLCCGARRDDASAYCPYHRRLATTGGGK